MLAGRIPTRVRKYARATLIAALAGLAIAGWSSVGLFDRDAPPRDDSGWGRQAIGTLQGALYESSPIASANACGMGASSCFKCHNGQRAAAPRMDPKAAPWHSDHRSVNDSCVGCHHGNPRLVKKELSHTGMIKDPRTEPKDSCDGCHKSDNSAAMLKRYQKPS